MNLKSLLFVVLCSFPIGNVDAFNFGSISKKASVSAAVSKLKNNDEKVWIDRTWEGGIDRMRVNVIEPSGGTVKGAAFFMHGFSQYPEAYKPSLEKLANELDLTVVAVETGVVSKQVILTLLEKLCKLNFKEGAQYCLQQAVAEDTIQCIQMAKRGEEPFEALAGKPMGVYGHSMGGGLSFYAARQTDLDYVGCLAPVAGVEPCTPSLSLEKGESPKNALLVAGSLDCIARAKNVKEIYESAVGEGKNAVLAEIAGATHTEFEDRLVITSIPLANLLCLLNVPKLIEVIIVAVRRLLTQKEIALSRSLMSYVFSTMLENKGITQTEVENHIDNDPSVEDGWADSITYD